MNCKQRNTRETRPEGFSCGIAQTTNQLAFSAVWKELSSRFCNGIMAKTSESAVKAAQSGIYFLRPERFWKTDRKGHEGFSLIELLMAITIILLIVGVVYFCLNSSLESWSYSSDQLSLQKTLSETMDTIINGSVGQYGLKDSLQIVSAGKSQIEFVPPWVDDTHQVMGRGAIYTLNRTIKPGSSVPIGQAQLANSRQWKLAPVNVIDLDNSEESKVQMNLEVPEGTAVRFIYHPDSETNPDVVRKIYWKEKEGDVFIEDQNGRENISRNMFGVKISKMEISYYTNSNEIVSDREWVDDADIPVITGVEVFLEAKINESAQSLRSFVSLRNAPMRTGYLTLRRGMKIRVPDSKNIHTLMLTNLSGIANNDRIQLEAIPRGGRSWRLTVEFEKMGSGKPSIKMYSIEYPPDRPVFTDYPRTSTELGLNLKLLGTDGLYDYDDDDDVDDIVLLDGEVELVVEEMNVKGAGLFMRP